MNSFSIGSGPSSRRDLAQAELCFRSNDLGSAQTTWITVAAGPAYTQLRDHLHTTQLLGGIQSTL